MTKKTKIFIIAGVALAAVGVGVFFLLKKDKDDSGISTGGSTTGGSTTGGGGGSNIGVAIGDVKDGQIKGRG